MSNATAAVVASDIAEELMTADGDDVVTNQRRLYPGQRARSTQWRPAPPRTLSHPELFDSFLPHPRMLHQNASREMALKVWMPFGDDPERALHRPSLIGQIFPDSFAEIADKKWLRADVQRVIDAIVGKVTSLPPYSFLLRYAPLHDITGAWDKKGSAPSKSAAAEPGASGTSPHTTTSAGTALDDEMVEMVVPARLRGAFARQKSQLDSLKTFLLTGSASQLDTMVLSTTSKSVYQFVRSYLVVTLQSKQLFGTTRNERIFFRFLWRYMTMGVGDRMPVGTLVHELDLQDIPFLRRCSAFNRDLAAAEFVTWLFGSVVNRVINRHFYVTTTQFRKHERMYMRREVWSLLCKDTVEEYVKERFWRPLETEEKPDEGGVSELDDFLNMSKSMQATYRARFVPREFGVRPLMIPQDLTSHRLNPYQLRLRIRNSRLIINYIMQQLPQTRGYGAADVAAIQKRWSAFRQQRSDGSDQRPLYFVSCDIQKAYDSIDLPTLKRTLQQLFQTCKARDMEFFFVHDAWAAAKKRGSTRVPPGTPRFSVVASKGNHQGHAANPDLGEPICVDLKELFATLSFMSAPAVFQTAERKWYSFVCGVPQGCSLASQFLSLYYGQLEQELRITVLADELLMRFMDDVVFITPCPHRARQFMTVATAGVAKVRLAVNPTKTHTNLSNPGGHLQRSREDYSVLSWYGWEFDLVGLNLKVDMRRYNRFELRYAYSVNVSDEAQLVKSLSAALTGKFAAPLFDPACCDRRIIIKNTYELFFISAVMLLAYWRSSQGIVRQQRRVLSLVRVLIRMLTRTLMARWVGAAVVPLGEEQVKALAWQAMVVVLSDMGARSKRSLGRGCCRAVIQEATVAMKALEGSGGWEWLVDFMSDRSARVPSEFVFPT